MTFVFKAAVVGAGATGGEIAHALDGAGIPVVLAEPGAYEGLGEVDFVIVAVRERMDLMETVFAELDEVTPSHAILASAAEMPVITELGDATGRADRVVGFHFLRPVAATRVVEIVEGEYTSAETVQTAVRFAQAIRRTPIVCGEAPGFVVLRILAAGAADAWRVQYESGAAPEDVDRIIVEAGACRAGPFTLADRFGLDAILRVVESLRESYGERFYLHPKLRDLVEAGDLGVASGRGSMPAPDLAGAELAERFTLRTFVEACLILEEGVATMRDIDSSIQAGLGVSPPPLQWADRTGLESVLGRLERAGREWGEAFEPPSMLRRLISQGRNGAAVGQGFFSYPRPDPGWEESPVKLETREAFALLWLDNPPANSLSPEVAAALRRAWEAVNATGAVRALVICSANPMLFCAGADIKAFARMDATASRRLAEETHALLRDFERSSLVTIAAVGGVALGGGCELAMGCDLRIASDSASFGQPEIGLGIIPGFGGTQRLPRLVGTSKALEMNLTGEPVSAEEAYELGLANRLVPDHELLDTAIAFARKLAAQAPLAVQAIKRVSANSDLDAGIERETDAFAEVIGSADAREGLSAFVEKRAPRFSGR